MQKLLDNEGRIINSIIKTGYYLEDGNFEDETVYPHTKETEEIYKKALEAKGNKKVQLWTKRIFTLSLYAVFV